MSGSFIRKLFLAGAAFNWVIAILLLLAAPELFQFFRIGPLPTEPVFLHLFAWLVFVFGFAYYWVAKNPAENLPLIRLGVIGKLGVAGLGLAEVTLGAVSWQFMLLTSVDLVFAGLFVRALKDLRPKP